MKGVMELEGDCAHRRDINAYTILVRKTLSKRDYMFALNIVDGMILNSA
jgi:hypothetical protein